jgi:hypothetical protein
VLGILQLKEKLHSRSALEELRTTRTEVLVPLALNEPLHAYDLSVFEAGCNTVVTGQYELL